MFGSATDVITAYLEHATARIEAKTDAVRATAEARRSVKLETAKIVPNMIAADVTLSKRAVAFLGNEMIVEQANRERILEHAVEDLRSAPPQEDPDQEIDDDWLHGFMKEPSTKSAPEMQPLFGKILSGEIKRPGAFSLKAIRTLSMLKQSTAKQFEKLCNLSVSVGQIGIAQVISYSGNAAQNALAKHGLSFEVLNHLNENDLIYSDFNSWYPWQQLAEASFPFEYAGQTVWLKTIDPSKTVGLSQVHGVMFSAVGKELRQVVSMQSDPAYTSELIKYFEGQGCDLIKAVRQREDGFLVGTRYRDLLV